jgi:hypothetical protein
MVTLKLIIHNVFDAERRVDILVTLTLSQLVYLFLPNFNISSKLQYLT